MNRFAARAVSFLLLPTWLAAQEAATQPKAITLDQVFGGGGGRIDFRGEAPSVRWAPDGGHLLIGDDPQWKDPRTGAALAPPAGADKADNADKKPDTPRRRRAARTSGDKKIVQTSPTGTHDSFVRGNNLVIVDSATDTEWAVTEDGSDNLLNGILDWVYQEEVYGRGDYQAHWWSPKGDTVAFLRLDQAKVKDFVVVDYIVRGKTLDQERHVRPVPMKYPKAGDDNPVVTFGVALPLEKRVQWVDLARFPADLLIVHVGFTPKGDRVVFQAQDRVQTWLELCYADQATGKVTSILREESQGGWVNRLEQPQWLADGTFLWQSERTGKKGLYHYDADGKLLCALTAPPVVVGDVVRVDEARKTVWFTGHDGRAVDRHLFRVALDGSSKAIRLTKEDGSHQTSLSKDGALFLDTWSSLASPVRVQLCDADGKVLQEFGQATPKDLDAYGFVAPKLFTVTCRDGCVIDASLLAPRVIDAQKKHPIWIETYSGPNAPSVRNAWSASLWAQFLQQQGYALLQVNVRCASGKGHDMTQACYRQLGVQELRDLEDAIAQVCKEQPWADSARVGITGWSYGGTMAAFALTHSKAFKLGIAGAGVYDWRLYDSIYTERYMQTPQSNPDGYKASSVIEGAKDLHGHLLLLHGTDDDNVHVQNCMRLIYALQRAGKDFAMMLYPTATHGVSDQAQNKHMRALMWKAMQTQLGGG